MGARGFAEKLLRDSAEIDVGDWVEYFSTKRDKEPTHAGPVTDVYPKGIPSCPKPMVKIKGKAGVVLASHCRIGECPECEGVGHFDEKEGFSNAWGEHGLKRFPCPKCQPKKAET